MEILLSVSTTPVIGWIAQLLGWIMNAIYWVLDAIHIPNVGLAIIFYTIITYLLLTPLQIKQQKMSKMMSIIQPEIQKIQKKYQGKRDQATQMKIQEETMGLYQKYGISPTGSCLPLLIQLPILFGLYQVIYHIPGYISKVANIFSGLANEIIGISNSHEVLTAFAEANKISVSFGDSLTQTKVIDFLYMLKPNQWDNLAQVQQFGSLQPMITDVAGQSERINSFLGINISQSPWDVIQSGIAAGTWLLVIAAVLVPVLAWFTQWLNYKLMPQQSTAANPNDSMGRAMKMMNTIMPLFSAFICVTLSMGIAIYWIAGAVIRCIQQVVINRRIMKMDGAELIQKSQEKQEKKRAKKGLPQSKITNQAHVNVKNIKNYNNKNSASANEDSTGYYNDNARPDSITAKANMVRQFDLKNSKKK